TARARRQMGQKVVVLEPFPKNGGKPQGSFNPLAELDINDANLKDDAGAIADALVVANERDPHWTDSARILVKALILYTLTLPLE
ncbi:type IV secretory system conjugative DNA transfer family protein, partial [Acinetobacter baumannii]